MDKEFPIRTCLGCYNKKNKSDLLRIVKTSDGNIKVDITGKSEGRGSYICHDIECLEKLIKTRRLNKALKINITETTYEEIRKAIESGK